MNLFSLVDEFDKAYTIPSPIMISMESKPTDIRQVCDTVADFELFLERTGMDIRYPGLITYEESTNLFKGYRKDQDGNLFWETVGSGEGSGGTGGDYTELLKRIESLEGKASSVELEWE